MHVDISVRVRILDGMNCNPDVIRKRNHTSAFATSVRADIGFHHALEAPCLRYCSKFFCPLCGESYWTNTYSEMEAHYHVAHLDRAIQKGKLLYFHCYRKCTSEQRMPAKLLLPDNFDPSQRIPKSMLHSSHFHCPSSLCSNLSFWNDEELSIHLQEAHHGDEFFQMNDNFNSFSSSMSLLLNKEVATEKIKDHELTSPSSPSSSPSPSEAPIPPSTTATPPPSTTPPNTTPKKVTFNDIVLVREIDKDFSLLEKMGAIGQWPIDMEASNVQRKRRPISDPQESSDPPPFPLEDYDWKGNELSSLGFVHIPEVLPRAISSWSRSKTPGPSILKRGNSDLLRYPQKRMAARIGLVTAPVAPVEKKEGRRGRPRADSEREAGEKTKKTEGGKKSSFRDEGIVGEGAGRGKRLENPLFYLPSSNSGYLFQQGNNMYFPTRVNPNGHAPASYASSPFFSINNSPYRYSPPLVEPNSYFSPDDRRREGENYAPYGRSNPVYSGRGAPVQVVGNTPYGADIRYNAYSSARYPMNMPSGYPGMGGGSSTIPTFIDLSGPSYHPTPVSPISPVSSVSPGVSPGVMSMSSGEIPYFSQSPNSLIHQYGLFGDRTRPPTEARDHFNSISRFSNPYIQFDTLYASSMKRDREPPPSSQNGEKK